MTTLGEAPGGASLIRSLENAMKDLSLLYAHTPDGKAEESLRSYVKRIEPALIEGVGAGTAKIILEGFASAVMNEKHKIETAGTSRA